MQNVQHHTRFFKEMWILWPISNLRFFHESIKALIVLLRKCIFAAYKSAISQHWDISRGFRQEKVDIEFAKESAAERNRD